jgi:hypothetical protein
MHSTATMPTGGRRLSRIQWEAVGDIRLELAGHVRFPSGSSGLLHSHPFWELILIGSGSGSFRREGAAGTCATNDVLILKPGERHQFASGPAEPMELLYLGFSYRLSPSDTWGPGSAACLPSGPSADLIRGELRDIRLRIRQLAPAPMREDLRARIMLVISRLVGLMTSGDRAASAGSRRNPPPVQAALSISASCSRTRPGSA